MILNNLWCRICSVIISDLNNGHDTDLAELLRMTDSCRVSVEKVLSAPSVVGSGTKTFSSPQGGAKKFCLLGEWTQPANIL
jgi:hypothetical protein